ncbi:MAG: hypothetical protein IJ845_06250 [Bacteroidaceae bacterium]|nr:hypothetical protein [Bacteroidaceae bacterium]
MIHISEIAHKIEDFLSLKKENKFKIYIRINFNIDVYVCTDNIAEANNYQKEFVKSLINNRSQQNPVDSFYNQHFDSLKIKFIIVGNENANDDPFYQNMFSCTNDSIDWGPRYRFDSFLQKRRVQKNDATKKSTPIVTFYSYKGGMGRTTTMVAYAISLAANIDALKNKRVVIIDCDLEAPGYLNFFDLSEHNGLKSGKKNGLVEFICDAQLTNKPEMLDINDYIINVGLDNNNSFAYNNLDNIWIVPAGNLNEGYSDFDSSSDRNDYLEGLAKINLSSVQAVVEYFNLLFDKIKETLNPDIILIDSRTGFNDIFGTAALYLSSCVIGFFGFSRQTQPGLINLLKEYYKDTNNFKLQLVFSILPENSQEDWINIHKQEITGFVNYIGVESKDYPSFLYLHRNPLLEKIGTGDEQSDSEFVKLVQSRRFDDYNNLFDRINDLFFKPRGTTYTSNTPAIQLRNVVLKHLKDGLVNVSNFAEDTNIIENQFFYRECMKELFEQKKFLIQGYKGTGKTYLYKALSDDGIASNIQQWAGVNGTDMSLPIFVNILPTNESSLVFDNIHYASIEEPEYYFNTFWQIYTWNSLLLRQEFETIKNESELSQYVKPLSGAGYAKEALVRIDELINQGVKILISIERDITKINDFLSKTNKRLFVLYDRLDTCINPLRWNKAVSPLINYWRNNCETFSNIAPKIFVRTDLFKQIEGTNTARLENSIIHIEWSIGEVFGFFFKLIFSNRNASDAFWAIAEKVKIDSRYIMNTKNSFKKFPYNQFKSLTYAEMTPIIRVFFGKIVKSRSEGKSLGTPWEYFEKELSNADNTAISLRPFINTLNENAVDKALAKTERYVKDGIIPSEIYASKAVREETTEKYFNDLTQDAFSKDLLRFREVLRSSIGEEFRYKALTEVQFDKLISVTFEKIEESPVVKSAEDLKRLIFANGIMAEKITIKGKYYRFAPIYWYSWGLVNSALEKEEKKKISKVKSSIELIDGESYEGKIVEVEDGYGQIKKRVQCLAPPKILTIRDKALDDFYEDDIISFVARKDINKYDPLKVFWYATDIRIKEE